MLGGGWLKTTESPAKHFYISIKGDGASDLQNGEFAVNKTSWINNGPNGKGNYTLDNTGALKQKPNKALTFRLYV
ncbi:hypothetical protein [Bacillus cereus]|uniref:hypothetical protein n=1 Tax=Bacillus cereus TaxID=1396 RepID=UPI0018F59ABB|nr:hypothetical protein [Bacillus cereus]MBJ8026168.1 hypothetical protein [Bacillus cereus]MBJ8038452.1 hypothetical protein [Bacillus cereus]